MSDHLLHEERAAAPKIAVAIGLVALALVAADAATGFALKGWGIVASPLLLVSAATAWSLARYNTIRLTPNQLVVGRATYVPIDFDTGFGVRTVEALTNEELALVNSPMPIPRHASVQIAGGGWGKPIGSGVLVLRPVGSETKLAITTRHVDELGSRLGEWLTASH
jgi:hypothetical protein